MVTQWSHLLQGAHVRPMPDFIDHARSKGVAKHLLDARVLEPKTSFVIGGATRLGTTLNDGRNMEYTQQYHTTQSKATFMDDLSS